MALLATAAPLMDVDDNVDLGLQEVTVTANGVSLDPGTTEIKDSASGDVGDVLEDVLKNVSAASIDLNDIVILDDDDEIMGGSSMKDKTIANDSMDVDENELLNSEDKENISKTLKRLSRKELEELVLVKVVEAVVKHSQAGKLRTKVLQMQTQKDKMFQMVGSLQKQVQEMSKAMKILLDNQSRDPNFSRIKAPPLKFYRSVGLQIVVEKPFRTGPAKVIHVNETPINGFKTVNGAVYNVSTNISPQKRPSNEALNGDVKPGTNVVRIINGQGGPKSRRSATYGNGQQQQFQGVQKVSTSTSASPTKTVSGNVPSPTVVDLTDDSGIMQTSQNVITAANGMQFRILNPPPQGVQIIQSPTNQSYQFVTSQAGQVRPILLAQNMSGGQGKPMQAMSFRNVAPKPTTATGLPQTRAMISHSRPSAVPSILVPRVAATIGTMVRAPIQPITPKKFQLPALPPGAAVSIPKSMKMKELPPRPSLTLSEQADGIVLSWTFKQAIQASNLNIASYQIYACQESLALTPGKTSAWKKVGDVKALPLPMACTLSQFTQGNRYFFIVRGVDMHGRSGPFCEPAPIILQRRSS